MRIATWNVNSVKQRLPRLLPWLDERQPDVVCLQETKLADDAFKGTFDQFQARFADGISDAAVTTSAYSEVVRNDRGLLIAMGVNGGSTLAVLVGDDCDMGLVAYEMSLLVVQVGDALTLVVRGAQPPG